MSSENIGDGVAMVMPKYKCHKEVWALKIKDIVHEIVDAHTTRVFLVFEDERYARVEVMHKWLSEKYAETGGYYVVYKDGYSSFSPGDAFEAGYTHIDEQPLITAQELQQRGLDEEAAKRVSG